MSHHDDTTTDAGYAAALSPLGGGGGGGGGGGDDAYAFGYLDADRALEVKAAVAVHADSDSDDDGTKKKQKKTKQLDSPTHVVAIPIDVATKPSTHGIKTGEWSTGICNCFEVCVPNCCMVTFCPCFSASQIAVRLGFPYQTALAVFGGLVAVEYILYCVMFATIHTTEVEYSYGYYYYYETSSNRVTVWGYLAFLLSVVLFIAYWQLRTKVRERFQLPGSCVEDFCCTFFCSCCALAQMATHVKSYKPGSCDFGAPDELPAYDE